MIELSYSGTFETVLTDEKKAALQEIHANLINKQGQGSEFLGWLDWPSSVSPEFLRRIQNAAESIQQKAEVLVVIGIGGSYLGAKAALSSLSPYFDQGDKKTEVLFAGHHVSGEYLKQLLSYLDGKEVMVNVISKSGKTTEPALAFRFLKKYMDERYGDAAAERIIVTTDAEKGHW